VGQLYRGFYQIGEARRVVQSKGKPKREQQVAELAQLGRRRKSPLAGKHNANNAIHLLAHYLVEI
jgi:hypothetical protein